MANSRSRTMATACWPAERNQRLPPTNSVDRPEEPKPKRLFLCSDRLGIGCIQSLVRALLVTLLKTLKQHLCGGSWRQDGQHIAASLVDDPEHIRKNYIHR